MADLKKLDWFANWQNAAAFLLAIGVTLWLGPFSLEYFVFVFVIAFAAARLLVAGLGAAWKALRPGG